MKSLNEIISYLLISAAMLAPFTTYVSGMDAPEKDLTLPGQSLTVSRPFNTIEEMINFGTELHLLSQNSPNPLHVIDVALNTPSLQNIANVGLTLSDLETFTFNRMYALTLSYYRLADQITHTDSEKATEYFTQATRYAKKYLKKFNGNSSRLDYVNHRILARQFILNKLKGESYSGLFVLTKDMSETQELATFSITSLQNSLEASRTLSKVNADLFATIKPMIPNVTSALILAYCNQASYFPPRSQAQTLILNKARALKKDLKRHSELYKMAERSIQIAANNSSALHLTTSKDKRSLKRSHITANKAEAQNYDLALEIAPTSTPHIIMKERHILISKLNDVSLEDQVISIKNIEKIIADKYGLSPEENLQRIYEIYRGYIRDEQLILKDIRRFINIFIQVGDMEGALLRTKALVELSRNNAPDLLQARIFDAGIQNFKGNPEPWLNLEKELQDKVEKATAKKKAARERAKQNKASRIKESINKNSTIVTSTTVKQLVPIVPSTSLVGEEKKESFSSDKEHSNSLDNNISVSSKESKKAKLIRHQEAEEKRKLEAEEEKKELPSVAKLNLEQNALSTTVSSKVKRERELEDILKSSTLLLSELYPLSGLPLEVDNQIESGNWRFTRDELQSYFLALGCTYEANGGNHRKMALPEAIYVKQGDEVITIFNEFGGALTLPAWVKDYAPNYLKEQILAAREKLRALKIKTLNINN